MSNPSQSSVQSSLDNSNDTGITHETIVPKTTTTTSSNRSTYETIAESLARITFAGLAGSMNGLALEKRQQQRQEQQQQSNTTTTTTTSRPGKGRAPIQIHRGRPDWTKNVTSAAAAASSGTIKSANLPITWALSCMVFVGVLESFRVTSPTSKLYDSFTENYEQQLVADDSTETRSDDDSRSKTSFELFEKRIRRTAIVSIGDYTMGGAVAGLAGAASRINRNPVLPSAPPRRPAAFLLWGCTVGIGFGMIAGILQASIEIGKIFVDHEQNERRRIQETNDTNV